MIKLIPLWDTVAGNLGYCIHQNKYLAQDDEYNYHDSLQACLRGENGHWASSEDL